MLSPSEWSKLLLAKTLARLIYLNSNPMASSNSIQKCLVGNILLLDDALQYLDEIEESKLIQNLRKTGAATVMTSNRWACGRFADKISVMKDGAIIDSGTHDELLNKGAMYSWYAAKWQMMIVASA